MVSIVAFQAVDPGSIPGHRTSFLLAQLLNKLLLDISSFVFEALKKIWRWWCNGEHSFLPSS